MQRAGSLVPGGSTACCQLYCMPFVPSMECALQLSIRPPSDRFIYRILMGSARPFQDRTSCEHVLEKGIVIENKSPSRILTKGSLQIVHDRSKSRLRERIEKIEHDRLSREVELARIT